MSFHPVAHCSSLCPGGSACADHVAQSPQYRHLDADRIWSSAAFAGARQDYNNLVAEHGIARARGYCCWAQARTQAPITSALVQAWIRFTT